MIARIRKLKIYHILAAFILTRLAIMLFTYHHLLWDEAVFIGMGKHIYSAGQSGIWEWIRPLGLPLLLGALWLLGKASGLSYIILSDLLMLLFSTGCIYLTYRLATRIADEKTGLLSAAALALAPVFFSSSHYIMTGIPSLFFSLLALECLLSSRYILAGFFSGIAFLFRFPAGLIIVTISLIILASNIRRLHSFRSIWQGLKRSIFPLLRFNSFAALPILAYLIYSRLSYGSFLGPLLLASKHQESIVDEVSGMLANLLYYPYVLILTMPFLALIVFFRSKTLKGDAKTLFFPLTIMLIYFTIIPHKEPRFALLFLPYAIILASMGFFFLTGKAEKYLMKKRGTYQRISRSISLTAASILLLLVIPILLDLQIVSLLPADKPAAVDDYYRYFEGTGKVVLTSDPLPAGYSDNLYIGYYNNITDAHAGFDEHPEDADALIYTPASFPCRSVGCNLSKTSLETKIEQRFKLKDSFNIRGQDKFIYVK